MSSNSHWSGWFIAGLGLVIGAVLLIGARSIAPPLFDPVGSAALPQACAVALVATGLGALAQSLLRARREGGGTPPPGGLAARPATAGTIALMGLYLAAMEFGAGFVMSTIFFISLTIPLVSRSLRVLPLGIAVALVFGFGAEWLFTSVFFVDLPSTQ